MKRQTLAIGTTAAMAVVAAVVAIFVWSPFSAPPAPPPGALAANTLPIGFKPFTPPIRLDDVAFEDETGRTVHLSDFRGRPVLLNIWAKWCAPCLVELPRLDLLQSKAAPGTLAVVAVAVDEPDPAKVKNFLANHNMTALTPYLDPKNAFARALQIRTIPVSVLIDKNGYALVRADAPIEWFSDDAVTLLQRLIL